MPDGATPVEKTRPKTGSALRLLIGLAALAALVVGVLHFGDAERFVALVRGARPDWLLAGLALQAATYAAEAGVWVGVLARAGRRRPLGELYQMAVVGLFTSQAVPSGGVSGTLVVVHAMERRGVPHAVAVSAVLVDLIGYYVAFGLAIGFGLAVLWAHHDLSPLVLAMAVATALLGFGICGGALWVTAPGRAAPPWLQRWAPARRAVESLTSADPALLRDPRLLARAALLRTGNFALDGLTLWVCLAAIGHPAHVATTLASFVVGALANTLGPIPGGLGTTEGGTVGALALFGVAVEPGLAATLLFRGLSFWLPMLPGMWLGRRLSRAAAPS